MRTWRAADLRRSSWELTIAGNATSPSPRLHRAQRDVLRVHPRDDPAHPLTGVFATRSAERPNPIGLHPVQVVAVERTRVRVRSLEAVDGTPIVDLKPVRHRDAGT